MKSWQTFERHRGLLVGLAYRMLGTRGDAEDIVQDAFLRWRDAPDDSIRSPRAYLVTVTTRLCLDHLKSARSQRVDYVGSWLPEPWIEPAEGGQQERIELDESLSTAFLLLLERLDPTARAVFVLREVFEFEYAEISRMVGKSVSNCRQIARRARLKMARPKPHPEVAVEQQDQLVARFLEACSNGRIDELMKILNPDVVVISDGGGQVRAATRPVKGANSAARLMIGIARKAPPNLTIQSALINQRKGLLIHIGGRLFAVLSFQFSADGIETIYLLNNPHKLKGCSAEPADSVSLRKTS